MKKAAHIIGTLFGVGYFPIAPGTAASLVTIIVLWFISPISLPLLLAALFFFFLIGVPVSSMCEQDWGMDPGRVVWDEMVGMTVSILALPKHWFFFAAAFLLFRVFDVLKPFPINASQDVPRGWGVMIDDVIAGLFANIILQIVCRFIFPSFAS
jgi:phosphatidylglycerophosphatase A